MPTTSFTIICVTLVKELQAKYLMTSFELISLYIYPKYLRKNCRWWWDDYIPTECFTQNVIFHKFSKNGNN